MHVWYFFNIVHAMPFLKTFTKGRAEIAQKCNSKLKEKNLT